MVVFETDVVFVVVAQGDQEHQAVPRYFQAEGCQAYVTPISISPSPLPPSVFSFLFPPLLYGLCVEHENSNKQRSPKNVDGLNFCLLVKTNPPSPRLMCVSAKVPLPLHYVL